MDKYEETLNHFIQQAQDNLGAVLKVFADAPREKYIIFISSLYEYFLSMSTYTAAGTLKSLTDKLGEEMSLDELFDAKVKLVADFERKINKGFLEFDQFKTNREQESK